jgi:hypothetical protein
MKYDWKWFLPFLCSLAILGCTLLPETDVVPKTTAQVGGLNTSTQKQSDNNSRFTQGDNSTLVIADPNYWGWDSGDMWQDLIPPVLLSMLTGGMVIRSSRQTKALRRVTTAIEKESERNPLVMKRVKNRVKESFPVPVRSTNPVSIHIHKAAKYAEKVVKNGHGSKESNGNRTCGHA